MSVHRPPEHMRPQVAQTLPRRVALFGGTFDPCHAGHLAVARAADRKFHLDEILFIPSGAPPHKLRHVVAPFPHRFAMTALACADHPHFVPSLAEAGPDLGGHRTFYSIETVRHFRHVYNHPGDHLYFILGADSFLHLPTWKEYEALLNSVDFIVASRPGFRIDALRLVIPPELRARPGSLGAGGTNGGDGGHAIHLRKTTIHLLDSVSSDVSSTEIRRRRRHHESVHGLVPVRVEEYILKQDLYH